jgi:photosystem II stability/assembly factor-like uncharacterized protein
MISWRYLRNAVFTVLVCWFAAQAAQAWQAPTSLGPNGGDVRRLAYVPDNPSRMFLGTSSSRLYLSEDGGRNWAPFARLGNGFDLVLDSIVIDPHDTKKMFVGAWSIERNAGDVFRSTDAGRHWTALAGMHDKSVRSLTMAQSDSSTLVAGALDGVYRTTDGGDHWKLISPPNHADIKNIQSVAVDPQDTKSIYAGTWHLAWKTDDGGKSWHQINRGMIDDSDVFSIIVDPKAPNIVYASACSGIYKSQAAGELFSKVQGIPSSARRTRVLKQDPNRPDVVYAGTTEGLWRTEDAGKHWRRISAASLIVNDVQVDPRDSHHILLATDRSGVMVSDNDGQSFTPSNAGFTHRQVTAVLVDRKDPHLIYAGVVNDKQFGGVFLSSDSGRHWKQFSLGLGNEDVFTLGQDRSGRLFAGTNRGLFRYIDKSRLWMRVFPKLHSQSFQVNAEWVEGKHWIVAGPQGIAHSHNDGLSWTSMRNPSSQPFISVHSAGDAIVAATHDMLFTSMNDGETWSRMPLPSVSYVRSVLIDDQQRVWLATPQGAFLRQSSGTWMHVPGLPDPPTALAFDESAHQVLAFTAGNDVFAATQGDRWERLVHLGMPARTLVSSADGIYAGTLFDGVVSVQKPSLSIGKPLGLTSAESGGGK